MLRTLVLRTGVVTAALGMALSVPGVASATDPSATGASAGTARDGVIAQGWEHIRSYPNSPDGALRCGRDAADLQLDTTRPAECRTRGDSIELWFFAI